MKLKYLTAFSFGSLLLLVATTASGALYQSAASMQKAVSEFLSTQHNMEDYRVGKIDKRLRLKSCGKTLKARFPNFANQIGQTTVELSCPGPKHWKFLVSVYIKKYLNVLTTKHSMPTGSALTAADLRFVRQDVSRLRTGYFTHISQITNMIVRRPVKQGKILSPAMLKPKRLVSRGDEVLIMAETSNLSIRVKGKALMNGFLGERIRVKNMNSKRIFQATVISNGLVKVNM